MISSCKDKDIPTPPPTPKEGEVAFAIDSKPYVGEAEITPVNGIGGARNLILLYEGNEVVLSIKLYDDTTTAPLSAGDQFDYDPNDDASSEVTFYYVDENGFIIPEQHYQLSSGFVRIDEYDRAEKKLSLTFDLVMEKFIAPDDQVPLEGAALKIPVLD